MLGWLRRRQPRNPALAALFWLAAIVVALAVLFAVFYWLDNFLPGQGMF